MPETYLYACRLQSIIGIHPSLRMSKKICECVNTESKKGIKIPTIQNGYLPPGFLTKHAVYYKPDCICPYSPLSIIFCQQLYPFISKIYHVGCKYLQGFAHPWFLYKTGFTKIQHYSLAIRHSP